MPNSATEAVQSALEEVHGDGNAESQTADESSTEVADAVKGALGSEESASESETEKSADEKSSKESKTVPYDRFTQVVKQKNEFSERYKNLEEQFKNAGEREKELRDRIGNLEQDHQILDAIKNLAQNEKYRDHVVAIDRALQGLDEEIDEAQKKGDDKAESEALKKFEQKTAELEDLLADQNAERLWGEASEYAKQMLQALPDEYTDEDKSLIGELWTPRVDWNRIEAEGSESIPDALKSSFVDVLKRYKTPRGALVAKTTEEIENRNPGLKVVSEEDTVKSILGKEWSAKDKDGKVKHSDEEFAKDMADLLRRVNKA